MHLLLFVFWMLFDDYGIVKRIRMEAEHRMLIDRQKVEQKKIIDNEQRIRYALEPDSIEKAARERYNFRKPGETLFIIRENIIYSCNRSTNSNVPVPPSINP